MKHAATRMIFSYWDTLRGERAAPERGEIEPGEIRHVLADTFILEIKNDRQCEFRLAGTRICALFGRELKGADFNVIWSESERTDAQRNIDTVTMETAGIVAGLVGKTPSGNPLDLEMILLPLRHRGKTHSRVLGALSPAILPPWLGFDSLSEVSTSSMRIIWPTGRVASRGFAFEGDPQERRRRFIVHEGGRY
jgi:hypothetical protein